MVRRLIYSRLGLVMLGVQELDTPLHHGRPRIHLHPGREEIIAPNTLAFLVAHSPTDAERCAYLCLGPFSPCPCVEG